MVFISVTRLRVRSILFLPAFFIANERSAKELMSTKGFMGGKELIDKKLTFWTVTAWENLEAMKVFRNSMAHRKAMQKLPGWCNEASYVHWSQENNDLPDWGFVYQKMIGEGKMTKVKQPSVQQLSKNFPAPVWLKTERVFKKA